MSNFSTGDQVTYRDKDWVVISSGPGRKMTIAPIQNKAGKELKLEGAHLGAVKLKKAAPASKKQSEIEIEVAKGARVGNINVKESFLASLFEDLDLKCLVNARAADVKNAFFANYAAALVLLKLQDLRGLELINDHGHADLVKFSPHMSDLNFWARALFKADDKEVKARLKPEATVELVKVAKHVNDSRLKKILKVPLTAPDAVNWNEALGAILMLHYAVRAQSSYFTSIIRALHKWDSLNNAGKLKAINDALLFLMQSDDDSKVIPHLRKLSNLVATKKYGVAAQKMIGFSKLNETDVGGGAVSAAAIGSAQNAILDPRRKNVNSQTGWHDTKQDLDKDLGGLYRLRRQSPSDDKTVKRGKYTIRNGKIIKRMERKFIAKKFKAPEHLKPKKVTKEPPKNAAQAPIDSWLDIA